MANWDTLDNDCGKEPQHTLHHTATHLSPEDPFYLREVVFCIASSESQHKTHSENAFLFKAFLFKSQCPSRPFSRDSFIHVSRMNSWIIHVPHEFVTYACQKYSMRSYFDLRLVHNAYIPHEKLLGIQRVSNPSTGNKRISTPAHFSCTNRERNLDGTN